MLAGGAGPAGELQRSHATYASTIHWTDSGIEQDRMGTDRSVVLAHEVGHIVGLAHTYTEASLPTRRLDRRGRPYLTFSNPGWERHILADVAADRQRSEVPVGLDDGPDDRARVWVGGRAWLGYLAARQIVEDVLLIPSGGGMNRHGAPYFVDYVGRPAARSSWGCGY